MLISRASMKQQMKGNRMKKKPVVKKNIGKILGGGLIPAIMGKKPMMKLAESGMG